MLTAQAAPSAAPSVAGSGGLLPRRQRSAARHGHQPFRQRVRGWRGPRQPAFQHRIRGRLATFGRSAPRVRREGRARLRRRHHPALSPSAEFLQSSISAAGDLEQSVGAVDTVFKRSAGQMPAGAERLSQAVGLTRNGSTSSEPSSGPSSKNGGTDGPARRRPATSSPSAPTCPRCSVAPPKETRRGPVVRPQGASATIERYGVTLNQSKIDAEAAALGCKKVGNAFDNQAQQAATLSLICKQTADAQGSFARGPTPSPAAAAPLRPVGRHEGLARHRAAPVASRFVSFLNRSMEPTIARIRNGFRLFIDRTEGVRTAMREALLPVVQRVTKFLKENPAVIKGAAIALGVLAVAVGVVALAMGALSVATSPITAVILLVAGLGAGIAYLWKNSETFRNVVTKVGPGPRAARRVDPGQRHPRDRRPRPEGRDQPPPHLERARPSSSAPSSRCSARSPTSSMSGGPPSSGSGLIVAKGSSPSGSSSTPPSRARSSRSCSGRRVPPAYPRSRRARRHRRHRQDRREGHRLRRRSGERRQRRWPTSPPR